MTAGQWPAGFDLVVLGGNCFYELATPREQEGCIRSARASLKPGGHLFLDNDHMEGELDPAWCHIGAAEMRPEYRCPDGAAFVETFTTVWVDRPGRLWRAARTAEVDPDGRILRKEWTQQKHPQHVGNAVVGFEKHDFEILALWGDRKRSPYADRSERAIFWARRRPDDPEVDRGDGKSTALTGNKP